MVIGVIGLIALGELTARGFGWAEVVGPTLTVWDARLGKRLKANLVCERVTPRFRMRFSTNERGWRGPAFEPGHPTVVVLGDETSLGYGVDDGVEYPRRLEARLREWMPEVRVANLAMPDSATGRSLRLLRDVLDEFTVLDELTPRLVIFQVSGQGFDDDLREGMFVLRPDGTLTDGPLPIASTARDLQGIVESIPGLTHSHLFCTLRRMAASSESRSPHAPPRIPGPEALGATASSLSIALVRAAIRACAERTCPLLVVAAAMGDSPHASALRALCARHAVRLVELPGDPSLRHRDTPWWNDAGQQDIAARVHARITEPPALLR